MQSILEHDLSVELTGESHVSHAVWERSVLICGVATTSDWFHLWLRRVELFRPFSDDSSTDSGDEVCAAVPTGNAATYTAISNSPTSLTLTTHNKHKKMKKKKKKRCKEKEDDNKHHKKKKVSAYPCQGFYFILQAYNNVDLVHIYKI